MKTGEFHVTFQTRISISARMCTAHDQKLHVLSTVNHFLQLTVELFLHFETCYIMRFYHKTISPNYLIDARLELPS